MQTGLHIAVKTNNLEVVKKLITDNAFIDAADQLNRTPLFLAAYKNYPELVVVFFQINHSI